MYARPQFQFRDKYCNLWSWSRAVVLCVICISISTCTEIHKREGDADAAAQRCEVTGHYFEGHLCLCYYSSLLLCCWLAPAVLVIWLAQFSLRAYVNFVAKDTI
jgi:hypothetical protein